MGCGLCKAKVPSSASSLHIPKRVQQKNDLSPSSTWAASCSPAANTAIHGSDKNGSCSKINASTLSPSVSHEVIRIPAAEKNKDDAFKHLKQCREDGTGNGSDAETTHEKHSSGAKFENEDARQRCDTVIPSAAVTEEKKHVHQKKFSIDGGSPKTRKSSSSAPDVEEVPCRRLSLGDKEDYYKRLCEGSFEESKQREDVSGSKIVSSPHSDVPADERKCSSCEYFLLTETCQDYGNSSVDAKTHVTPEKNGTSVTETSNTCFDPLEKRVETDDSDSLQNIHVRLNNASKSRWDIGAHSQQCQEQQPNQGPYSTALLPCFAVAQSSPCLSQLDKVQLQEASRLALSSTPEKIKSLELSCCSNKWKEKFPSSKDIEHCIETAYEACVHYKVDIAEKQLAKAEELYTRMHAVCVGFTGKKDSSSSFSVASSPYAAASFSPRVAPVVRSALEQMPLPSHYDTKHLERKIENLRDTIQTLRQALVFYSGSRSLHTASLRNTQQQLQLQALHSQHQPHLQTQHQRLQKHQLPTLPALQMATKENVEDGSGRHEKQSAVWSSKPRTVTRSRRDPGDVSL